ncbi:hypothetical protein KBY97_08120 [Synechococcus sp. ATX 2A4]|uniref:hypothetical protein n=1 Tax=Synechococcus sp. ATX 2A4 TaxID=2823727 RepID=UPI0020CC5BD9|nr:hypothetical protein [Synechococcus sp. ATX 2A4]MCP9885090.1 hypothetical protein [Synechococcus sp. ATX 2A4]
MDILDASEVVIITSAICPAPNVFMLALSDPRARLIQVFACLYQWILGAKARRIVICDGTVDASLFSPFSELAKDHGVELEVLTFSSSQNLVSRLGKGYGEGEILRYVMLNSRLLHNANCFFKITGRLYIRNFREICRAHSATPVIFNRKPRPGVADTRFFKCSVDYFRRSLMDAFEKVNDRKGIFLEHLYCSILEADNVLVPFSIQPEIVGRSGTTGRVNGVGEYPQDALSAAEAIALAHQSFRLIPQSGTAEPS